MSKQQQEAINALHAALKPFAVAAMRIKYFGSPRPTAILYAEEDGDSIYELFAQSSDVGSPEEEQLNTRHLLLALRVYEETLGDVT